MTEGKVRVVGVREIIADVVCGWNVEQDDDAEELAGLVADAVVAVLQADMRWHEEHKGISGKGSEWEAGFVAGLGQAVATLRDAGLGGDE